MEVAKKPHKFWEEIEKKKIENEKKSNFSKRGDSNLSLNSTNSISISTPSTPSKPNNQPGNQGTTKSKTTFTTLDFWSKKMEEDSKKTTVSSSVPTSSKSFIMDPSKKHSKGGSKEKEREKGKEKEKKEKKEKHKKDKEREKEKEKEKEKQKNENQTSVIKFKFLRTPSFGDFQEVTSSERVHDEDVIIHEEDSFKGEENEYESEGNQSLGLDDDISGTFQQEYEGNSIHFFLEAIEDKQTQHLKLIQTIINKMEKMQSNIDELNQENIELRDRIKYE